MTASRRLFEACCLTIVGGGREASSVWGRGTQSILRARGPCRAWSCGPSTSPLGSAVSAFAYTDLFYPDPRPLVKVRAMLSVLGSEHGGHRITTQSSWRPNHNF